MGPNQPIRPPNPPDDVEINEMWVQIEILSMHHF